MTYSDYEREVLAEMETDILRNHPVLSRYRFVRFVSKSAGRNRKRKPREVAFLVTNTGKATSWHKVKFDEISTEFDDLDRVDSEQFFIDALLNGESEPDR